MVEAGHGVSSHSSVTDYSPEGASGARSNLSGNLLILRLSEFVRDSSSFYGLLYSDFK